MLGEVRDVEGRIYHTSSKDSGGVKLHDSASIGSDSASISINSSSSITAPSASTTPRAFFLSSKPFKCPTPRCTKSYKQAGGLKYHQAHGECPFMLPEKICVEGLTEEEAERKLRPYQCQVPQCTLRYRNMNGLRYHYQHSGDHGARELELLESGKHNPFRHYQYREKMSVPD